MELRREPYGTTPEGGEVERFTLINANGLEVSVITYGCILTSLRLPDREGRPGEITLGFDSLERYLQGHPYFGALVGRFANRIAGGRFELDGRHYSLACNENGKHHLHGGRSGFDKKIWSAEEIREGRRMGVRFHRASPDGEEGYPGTLEVSAACTLNDENELGFEYRAEADRPTPVNLTNHAYWNLAGAAAGEVYDHLLTLHCSRYLAVDEELIPTGEILSVEGTALDFRRAKPLGRDIGRTSIGYDNCLLIDRQEGALAPAARLYDPSTGRGMEISTTKPAIQLYTGNYLDGIPGAGGAVFRRHEAVCLETELYPDAVNHPGFPTAILRPGEVYHHVTRQRFFVE